MNNDALSRFNASIDSDKFEHPGCFVPLAWLAYAEIGDYSAMILDGHFGLDYLKAIVAAWEELIRETSGTQ